MKRGFCSIASDAGHSNELSPVFRRAHLPRRTTEQRSSTEGKEELFFLYVSADKVKDFFIVHQRLLSITAGHEQNIK